MKITYFRLKGYIKVLNGMGLEEIAIPFSEFKNRIVLVQGENGCAKSTIIAALSPNPDGSDSFRTDVFIDDFGNRQIIEYPAEKEIHYVGVDDFGNENYIKILIQSIVDDSRTRRTTKAFISKNGEELNPNGNVTSFKEIRDSVLGIDPIYLDLSSISAENRGIVDMIPSERRKYMASYVGSLDTYNNIFKVISKKVATLKSYMNTINSKLYELGDESELRLKLAQLTTSLKGYNKTRDELLKRLADAEATVRIVDPDNKMQDLYASISERLGTINSEMKQFQAKLERVYSQLPQELQSGNIDSYIEEGEKSLKSYEKTLDDYKAKIRTLMSLNEATMESLEHDRTILTGLTSNMIQDNTLEAADKLRRDVAEYEQYITPDDIKVLDAVSLDELVDLRETFTTFTKEIMAAEELHGWEEFSEAVIMAMDQDDEKLNSDRIREYNTTITENEIKISTIKRDIEVMVENLKELQEFSGTRPAECKIDTCPYIAKYVKLGDAKSYENKINQVESELKELIASTQKLREEMELRTKVDEIVRRLDMAISMLYSKSALKKIPGIDCLLNIRTLKSHLLNRTRYNEIEGSVVSNYIEKASIYDDLKKAKEQLKGLESDLKTFDSNKALIESLEASIYNNERTCDQRTLDIQEATNDVNFTTGIITNLTAKLDKLKDAKEYRDKIAELESEKDKLRQEFEAVKDKIKLVKEKMDSVNTIKSDIQRVEEAIAPLSDTISQISYDLTSMVQYQSEYKESADKYDKMVFIRNACSPGNGLGIQSEYIKRYMNDIIIDCNTMLGYMFGGSIRLDVPIINEKQFSIPFLGPNGIVVPDISMGSTAQKCMIGLVFSCVAMMKSSLKYNIPRFDEIDGGLDQQNRITFINVLNQILDFMRSEQCVICSHNMEFDTQSTTRLICSHTGIRIEQ